MIDITTINDIFYNKNLFDEIDIKKEGNIGESEIVEFLK